MAISPEIFAGQPLKRQKILRPGAYHHSHWRLEDIKKKISSLLFRDSERSRAKRFQRKGKNRLVWTRQGDTYITDVVDEHKIKAEHGKPIDQGGDGKIHGPNEP